MSSINEDLLGSPVSPTGPEVINIEGNPEAILSGRGLGTSTPFTQHDNAAIRFTARVIRAAWLRIVATASRIVRAIQSVLLWISAKIGRILQALGWFLTTFAVVIITLGVVLVFSTGFVLDGPYWDTAGPGLFFSGYFLMVIGAVGVIPDR
ncbi:hypothetical protein NM208_g4335 [Fusarium decemcellulare]|uniref:Uncharacterized protein n=1 Tax=Fusarium decemcellulare TaxID=57161 RepID=A0ACC1SL34_9HYPO|nr:hypothetical protein NM208_g4335 [Fusarium decemcellulare]